MTGGPTLAPTLRQFFHIISEKNIPKSEIPYHPPIHTSKRFKISRYDGLTSGDYIRKRSAIKINM
jgi:hypothetical protein